MAKQKKTVVKNKVFRPIFRRNKISVFQFVIVSLFLLGLTIAKWNAQSATGEIPVWWNSWQVMACFFLIYFFLLLDDLYKTYGVRLVLSETGVWYYRLWTERYISWEQIECAGIIRRRKIGRNEYGFILKPTELKNKQPKQVVSLSAFVDEWFVSELRSEIKRLNPLLPMQ